MFPSNAARLERDNDSYQDEGYGEAEDQQQECASDFVDKAIGSDSLVAAAQTESVWMQQNATGQAASEFK
eukprot:2127755-Rhodomonas_salina.8